jgi:intergrase/recombinase
VFNYALKYHRLLNEGFSGLHGFNRDKRRHILEALANLSKYLGCYDRFRLLKVQAGLKWKHENGFEAFRRLYDGNGCDGILEWLRKTKEALPYRYAFPVIFQVLTGLRPSEAIEALNIIAEKGLEGYYNPELQVLEHFRFPKVFLRGTKNAFISVITPSLLEALKKWDRKASWNMLRSKLRREGIPIRLQELRSYYATLLREAGIPSESIDMLQGRIPPNVFTRHYYKPALSGLISKVKEALKPLEAELLEL